MTDTFFVYRDILLPSSEAFIPRHYQQFKQLEPCYIGSRITPFFHQFNARRILTGTTKLKRLLFKQAGIITAPEYFTSHHPTLIHAHFGRGGALALPLAQQLDIPLFVTFHGGDVMKEKHYTPSRFYTIYQRRLARLKTYSKGFLCVSDFLRIQLAKRGFPEHKLHTHYIGIDLPSSRPHIPYKSERNNLLFVGRLVEKKGLDCLLHAYKIIQETHPGLALHIIGEGPEESHLRTLARTLKLQHVHFLGWQSPEQVAKAMQQHLVFCAPSQQAKNGDCEGLPTVIMEAQLHGCPVAATEHAGIPEIITHQHNGMLSRERDAKQLAHHIKHIVNLTEEQYNTMQTHALDRLYTHFNAAIQSQQLEERFVNTIHE